ncbi:MAG: divalent-cation tolerance protein CutA [Verrucomicrobiaceae bacterium]|nr:divalent-cation tolerance protein CutA [Verrucomicrobiaceae bacterium]
MDIRIVWVTFPDAAIAREIGTQMVESQLAACVNLIPSIESIYRWKGAVERTQEVLGIFKTSRELMPAFEDHMKKLHPYEVPEIVAFAPSEVSLPYAQWVHDETIH